jgi:hypothetical protein
MAVNAVIGSKKVLLVASVVPPILTQTCWTTAKAKASMEDSNIFSPAGQPLSL